MRIDVPVGFHLLVTNGANLLKDAIDRAWEELDRSGKLAEVFARWHVPYQAAGASGKGDEP